MFCVRRPRICDKTQEWDEKERKTGECVGELCYDAGDNVIVLAPVD